MLELGTNLYNFKDKDMCVADFGLDYLNRTLGMFEYGNLPDSIPEDDVESIFQINGHGIVTEHEDKLVALWGSWAPPYNVYYKPINYRVNNPWAKIDKEYKIQDDAEAVLIKNDPRCRGLMPIFNRYGSMMTEAQITFYRALINFRAMFVFTGDDDADKATADAFMSAIEKGESGKMLSGGFEKQINAQPLLAQASNYITQAIEAQQYVLGMLYQQIGIQSTFNMKRERQTANESQLDEDPLRPLIEAMLEQRQKGWERVNKKYGTDVTVEFKGVWSKYNPNIATDGDGMMLMEETDNGAETGSETEQSTEALSEETVEEDNQADTEDTVADEAVDAVAEVIEEVIVEATEVINEELTDEPTEPEETEEPTETEETEEEEKEDDN